jgi:hypothetical protein
MRVEVDHRIARIGEEVAEGIGGGRLVGITGHRVVTVFSQQYLMFCFMEQKSGGVKANVGNVGDGGFGGYRGG